ncbi:MAG: segregation/condensation protein A [Planctomycetes bacterium]|nr:segregation/condensation protein A [Planctomycetota bacterium]
MGDRRDRGRVVGTFLAMLQLSKDQKVRLEQDADRTDILIERGP